MKFAFYTLGCKTNQYETQAMERILLEMDHEIGAFDEVCDGYVINTCSVTAVADKKNRAIIRRCQKNHPEAVLIRCCAEAPGPGRLTKKLGITGKLNREDVTQSDRLWVEDDGFCCEVVADKRVGIAYASEEDQNRLWRFKMGK